MTAPKMSRRQKKIGWSDDEKKFIRANHKLMTVGQMAEELGKKVDSVIRMAQRLGYPTTSKV